MKICRICKIEYSEETVVCARCGNKLEEEQESQITPRDFEEGY